MSNSTKERFRQSLLLPAILIAIIWLIQIYQAVSGNDLGVYGVYPRKVFGLRGIFFSPLIHSGWSHLLSNTPPLFVLSAMILFFYKRVAYTSFFTIYILTGLAVWLFARDNAFHIGASGVIYGLVAFVFWNGIFRRNLKSIVLALVVVFYYGGMFVGIVPGQESNISWESHLLGGVVGILASFWFKNQIEFDEKKPVYSWEREEAAPDTYFLERDAFDKTKEERKREGEKDSEGDWFSTISW
ncbi:MAG: rhomboid family intramembrane serine protease [Chitinophagales bacterium]|nr:rhomboid family intramembrane serine protease [Chitinophagales bacterium]